MLTKLSIIFSCRFNFVIIELFFTPGLCYTVVIIYLNIVFFDFSYIFHGCNASEYP